MKKIKDKLQERAKYARGRVVVDKETGEAIELPTPRPAPAKQKGNKSLRAI